MIEELQVRGIGGIKDASIVFKGNFIVITGESGSGKSSLIRAIEFITGKRANSSIIHALEDAADVQLVLSADIIPGLSEEFQPQEGSLLVRRIFNRSGRGRCTIQSILAPLSVLLSAMDKEVVIQSQFAQLGLLEPTKQLELVDSCGGEEIQRIKAELDAAFGSTITVEREILAMKKKREDLEVRFQDAETILHQINVLQLTENSENLWETELKNLETSSSRIETLRLIHERLSGGTAGDGIIGGLEKICQEIYLSVPHSETKWNEFGENMLLSAQGLAKMLQNEILSIVGQGSIEDEQERLEKRIGSIRKIKRTLGLTSCSAVLQYAEEAEKAMVWLRESHVDMEQLELKSSGLRKSTTQLAMALRNLRKSSAQILAAKVNRHLKDLAMEYAIFAIEIEEQDKLRATGAESAIFTLCLPDQRPLPVGKTASGGELSRILIALQLSLGDDKLPGTLVFDEVEAGLGGRTALLAGYKLRQLSKRCRTVLITHEATIAAMADQHFLVKREGENTLISDINGSERQKEIARMLAGDDTSHEALEHAKSLLDNAE